MSAPQAAASVRSALLHRPPAPAGALERGQQLAALDAGLDYAATSVVAPAGYGKTVLVSQWSERLDRPVAWISLDGALHDLREFLRYLTAAVRAAIPDAMDSTALITDRGVLPTEPVLVTALSNDLHELDDPVVVLDDYHDISDPAVHRVMSELLAHPPRSTHFVIASRRDPPLPFASLRAGGRLFELRMADLHFSASETAELLSRELGRPVSDDEAVAVFEATEGWPVGIRLAIQAMRRGSTAAAGYLDRGAQEYLVAEVLERISPDLVRFMITASAFDRFSAELCDAALAATTTTPSLLTGREFIDWLQSENLFITPLDDNGVWYRFHHLFAKLLDDWREQHGASLGFEPSEPRRAAAQVLHEQGLIEEAIKQYALAGEVEELVALATVQGRSLVDEGRWGELGTLLSAVPSDVVDRQPALLVLQAWLVGEHGGRYAEMLELLRRAEDLLTPTTSGERELRGQIAVLRGTYQRLNTGDIDGALEEARTAQELLAASPGYPLAYAYVLNAVALANSGRYGEARRLADALVGDQRFADANNDPMVWTRPFLAWIEGSLDLLDRSGQHLLSLGEQFDFGQAIAYGHYFLGTAAYERDELDAADEHFSVSVDVNYTIVELQLHSLIGLAFTELAAGRPADALRTGETMVQEILGSRGDYNVPTAEAAMALLELRTGHRPAAFRWGRAATTEVPRHRYMFFYRTPALIEILLSSPPDAARGRELLAATLASTYGQHNRPVNLKLTGLAALDAARRGDDERALEMLRSAVERSYECGMVRRLADLGSDLVPLLNRLDVTGPVLAHVGRILRALEPRSAADIDRRASAAAPQVAGEPALTDRERDVLVLLAERYANKEISRELAIAPATVKKHTVTLYQKLNVHGRRQAVSKARALGYLQDGQAVHGP